MKKGHRVRLFHIYMYDTYFVKKESEFDKVLQSVHY